jgi:hypothetical protein
VTYHLSSYGYYASNNANTVSYNGNGLLFDTVGAAHVATGDLNADGRLDVVFANHFNGTQFASTSTIYYGDGLGGFTSETLPTHGAIGVAIADLDENGFPELVFGNHALSGTYTPLRETNSYIYWGESSGFHSDRKTTLPTNGADGVSIADLNQDGKLDIVISNNQDNQGNREIDSYIYWGTSSLDSSDYPAYGIDFRTPLPTKGATYNTIDDIDGDDWPDILFSNFRNDDSSPDYEIDSIIYWGSQSGFSDSDTTSLATKGASGCNVADLNQDGYKDILFSQSRTNATNNVNAIIYWGGENTSPTADHDISFSTSMELLTVGSSDNMLEDLDGDGWHDIVITSFGEDKTYVYWSTEGVFSIGNRTALPSISSWGLAIAKKD